MSLVAVSEARTTKRSEKQIEKIRPVSATHAVTDAEIVASSVANHAVPDHPDFADFGEILLRGAGASGYIRVDWYTPDGLPTWGDGRLTILGTEGFLEMRKYVDIAGRPGTDHVLDRKSVV